MSDKKRKLIEKEEHEEDEQEEKEEQDELLDEEDDDMNTSMPMPMPAKSKKKKSLKFESVYLDNLPSSEMYEKSYMHRDVVTHTLVTPVTQFLVTASCDGHLKFWKKMKQGIEFVKHYKAHLHAITGLVCSSDGLRLATTSSKDQTIKFYDVLSFDMVHFIPVSFHPTCCAFVHRKDRMIPTLAVADQMSSSIRIYQVEGETEPLHLLDGLHKAPVCVMAYNATFGCMLSSDEKGLIEYWDGETFTTPVKHLQFKFKMDTDLYELAKHKTCATSLVCSPNGKDFAVSAKDKQVRVFCFSTGKLRRKYDESLTVFEDAQEDGSLQLDAIDFGRRSAVEKELDNTPNAPPSNCLFDESGYFLLFPTLLGIKIINLETNRLVKVLGRVENTERFLSIHLFQGSPTTNTQMLGSGFQSNKPLIMANEELKKNSSSNSSNSSNSNSQSQSDRTNKTLTTKDSTDCMLFCTAFKKNRFYLFSQRAPLSASSASASALTSQDGSHVDNLSGVSCTEGRDVFNEKPTREESEVVTDTQQTQLGCRAVIHTTVGDIFVKLFTEECPRTIENFCTHARRGYYDNTLVHRVIKNFMVQMGDPNGDGTGGESIWGGEFEDEFHRNLRHDRPFTLSMANAGANTNGSQFFITTVPTPWLDNKHTVFGRVESGMDTVSRMENAKVDKLDKPFDDMRIINIDVHTK